MCESGCEDGNEGLRSTYQELGLGGRPVDGADRTGGFMVFGFKPRPQNPTTLQPQNPKTVDGAHPGAPRTDRRCEEGG